MEQNKITAVTVLPNVKFLNFLDTDKGHNAFDSIEVRLILLEETVFVLKMNEYIEKDTIGLINDDSEFTEVVDTLLVEAHTCIDNINYIFVKKAGK